MIKYNKLFVKLSFLIFHIFMYDEKLPESTVKQLQQLKTTLEGHVTDEVLGIEATKFAELQGQMILALNQSDVREVQNLLPKLVQSQAMIRIQLMN
jgi:hypothetical protein